MSKCNSSSTVEFLNLGLLFSVTAPEIRSDLDSRSSLWCGCPEHQVLLMAQVAFPSDAFTHYERGNPEKQQDFCGIYCVSARATRQGECQGHARVPGATDGGKGQFPLIFPVGQHQTVLPHTLTSSCPYLSFCVTSHDKMIPSFGHVSWCFTSSSLWLSSLCMSLFFPLL